MLGCELNVTPQHSRIIKQMVWEHVTKSHSCSRINSLNRVKPTSQRLSLAKEFYFTLFIQHVYDQHGWKSRGYFGSAPSEVSLALHVGGRGKPEQWGEGDTELGEVCNNMNSFPPKAG